MISRKKRIKYFGINILVLMLLLCLTTSTVSASTAYFNYNYDFWGNAVEMPPCYTAEKVLGGAHFGDELLLKSPQDIFIDKEKKLYIADTGNNRIIILDKNFKFLKQINTLTVPESAGVISSFNNPSGIFVSEDNIIYVADTDNKRVVSFDYDGNYIIQFEEPKGDVNYTAVDYLPTKIAVDKTGFVYVVSRNTYQGLITFSPDAKFQGYFASNKTEVTLEMIMDYFWKNFLTDEQRSKTANYASIEYSNIAIDSEGFLYTTTQITKTDKHQISKINSQGQDVMRSSTGLNSKFDYQFGDLENIQIDGNVLKTMFVDVCYDEKGFINALDYQRGRIFQYSAEGDLITVFGGIGNQSGTFKEVSAIEMLEDKIIVLDAAKNNITVFEPTAFGEEIKQAVISHRNGKYTEVREKWQKILDVDGHYSLAHRGIGKSYFEQEDYKNAMHHFKLGQDRVNYNRAYKNSRNASLRIFVPILFVLVLTAFILGVLIRLVKKASHKRRGVGDKK